MTNASDFYDFDYFDLILGMHYGNDLRFCVVVLFLSKITNKIIPDDNKGKHKEWKCYTDASLPYIWNFSPYLSFIKNMMAKK